MSRRHQMRGRSLRQRRCTCRCSFSWLVAVTAFVWLTAPDVAAVEVVWLKAEFFDEPRVTLEQERHPSPPLVEGKVFELGRDDRWHPMNLPVGLPWPDGEQGGVAGTVTGPDTFLGDGAETSLAIDIANPLLLAGAQNRGYSNVPSLRMSSNGNVSWTPRTFPNGSGTYTGQPYDPWAFEGNSANVLFCTFGRFDTVSNNTHVIIARSIDGGVTWPLFFERMNSVLQDRPMDDVDRTLALGGGSGTTHDGKVYLCYDNRGFNGSGYVGSFLQIVSPAGAALTELTISTLAVFRGNFIQPVSGVVDGQVYLLAHSVTGGTRFAEFHEITGAGAGTIFDKSLFSFPMTGQPLGTSGHWGVNGHRVNPTAQMDIDRTNGPRRGWLYVVSNRNPNQANPALDQGDVYVSVSSNGATSWTSAIIPGLTPGKTQFFSTIDVDDNGWLHVAYYQNESGAVNGGVLNASKARVYYTLSHNGGSTWSVPIVINTAVNDLDYFEPPPNLAPAYYLIGDYFQLKATGTGPNTKAYVFWTTYDKDRSDFFINDKRERTICTTLSDIPQPAPSNDNCVNAIFVTGGNINISTTGATTDGPNESSAAGCSPNNITNDVWYRYGALCAGTATLSLCNAGFDAIMAVYGSACPTAPGPIVCSDNSCGDDPMVSFNVTAGQIFRVRIGGVSNVSGLGTLAIICTAAPPCPADINDDDVVDVNDLLAVVGSWGATGPNPADINGDNVVDVNDLLAVVGAWGPCP